jgi:hypothetical protein
VRTGNEAINFEYTEEDDITRLKKMKMKKNRISAKRRMMHTVLDSNFLCETLFPE